MRSLRFPPARVTSSFLLGAAILFLGGCLRDGAADWSPDGRYFAVQAADGLRVADANGEFSPPALEKPTYICWLPGGGGLLAVSERAGLWWSDLESSLGSELLSKITQTGVMLKKELLACRGDYRSCKDRLAAAGFCGDFLNEAVLYLQQTCNDEMTSALGSDWKALSVEPARLFTFQLMDIDNGNLKARTVLFTTTKKPESVRLSQDGRTLLVVDEPAGRRLIAIREGRERVVSRDVSYFPDLSGDSAYFLQEQKQAGKLCKAVLSDGTGAFPGKFEIEELCAAAFDPSARVRCLRDGKVLFATSARLNEPQSTASAGQGGDHLNKVMCFGPDAGDAKELFTRRQKDGCGLCAFQVSPDQSRLTLPSRSNSELDVLQLADGSVTKLVGPQQGRPSAFAPCWRNDDELCLTMDGQSEGARRKVVLYSLSRKSARPISEAWPDAAVGGILLPLAAEKEPVGLESLLRDLKSAVPAASGR